LSVGFRVIAWFADSAHFWDDSLFSYLCFLTSAKVCFLALLYCAMVWLVSTFSPLPKTLFYKVFAQNCFCGSHGISLFTSRDAGRGKVVYIWISPNPAKAGLTLGGVVVV